MKNNELKIISDKEFEAYCVVGALAGTIVLCLLALIFVPQGLT